MGRCLSLLIFSSFRSIFHLLDVDLEASDQANIVHSIKCNIYIHLLVTLNLNFYSIIRYSMKKLAINKELVWFPFKSLLSIHSPRNSQYKQWITIMWHKDLHKHRNIVKIKRLDDPDQLSKGNIPCGTNPGYCRTLTIQE